MKSVMEEASSIAKAVEQAWERVGKPREFTVKVFEEAKHSFFGFTTQSAKIALIFDENMLMVKPTQERPKEQHHVKSSQDKHKQKFKKQHPRKQESPAHQPQQKTVERKIEKQDKQDKQSDNAKATTGTHDERMGKQKSLWTDEMIQAAQTWVDKNLKIIGLPNITFTTSAQKYYLRFQFDNCVLENKEKEKKLFSAFAHLIMATLRNKFKKELRGLKVVLISQN